MKLAARQAEQKKGADKGIDGRLRFHDEGTGGATKQVIFSVKAGHAAVAHLRGVVDNQKAAIGVLVSMEPPTRPMRVEAAGTGFYQSPGLHTKHLWLQLLTVEELLASARVDMPLTKQTNATFKRAPRARAHDPGALEFPLVQEPMRAQRAERPARPARRKK